MNRLTKMSFGIAVGVIAAAVSMLLAVTASASQGSGLILVNPRSEDFGDVVERVQEVTRLIEVRNTGSSNLAVLEMKMIGDNAADFRFSADWPFILAPGDDRRIVVTFAPSSKGPKEAVLRIRSSAQNQPQSDVQLKGNGLGLEVLGRISATADPNNASPTPGDLISVDVRVDMSGARPPAHLMQSYQASLSWDPAVLTFHGFTGGDSPWGGPASIGQENNSVNWFDHVSGGSGGTFSIIRLKFKVIGRAGSSTNLNLSFSRMEGEDVENLLPILSASGGSVEITASAIPPDIDVSPASHDYGTVPLGSSASRTFVVSNAGTQSLVMAPVTLVGANADQFSIAAGGGPSFLAAAKSREVVVNFNPTYQGTKAAALLFRSNDPDEPFYYVTLTGSVSAPDIEVEPGSLDFGNVVVGSLMVRTLVVRNRGTAPLHLTQFGLDNHQNQFAYHSGNLAILAPGESGNIRVFFNPTTEGAKNATFVIHSNDPDEVSVTVPLKGNGIRN